jgi:quinol monooxygenase YgiN
MILVTGSARVRPERQAEALQLARAMAARTRQEPGCVATGYYAALDAPDTFFLFQLWESEDALDAHYRQPHVREFLERLPELLAGTTAVQFLTRYEVTGETPL